MKKIVYILLVFLISLSVSCVELSYNTFDNDYRACFFTNDDTSLYLFIGGLDLGLIPRIDSSNNYEEKNLNIGLFSTSSNPAVEQQFFIKKFGQLETIAEGTLTINHNELPIVEVSKGIFELVENPDTECFYIKVGE